jgi:hypothetical protein
MSGAGPKILLAVVVGVASAAGVFLALEHGPALRDRLLGADTRWVEYACHGTREVSELMGPERIGHATLAVTERVFVDARSISLFRSDGIQSVITDFTRDETMAEWRSSVRTDGDGGGGHTLSTVGTLFFRTEKLMIREIETVESGGWDYQRSSLLSGACHVSRSGRY